MSISNLKRTIHDLSACAVQGKNKLHKDNEWDQTADIAADFSIRGRTAYFQGQSELATLLFYKAQEYGDKSNFFYLGDALESAFGTGFEGAIDAYQNTLSEPSSDDHFTVHARLGIAYRSRFQPEEPSSLSNLFSAKMAFESALKVQGIPEIMRTCVREALAEIESIFKQISSAAHCSSSLSQH